MIKILATPAQTQALMVDGSLIYDPEDQCEAWACYTEQLASPLQASHFDEEYHNRVLKDVKWIETLCENSLWASKPISQLEVKKSIIGLKLGKAAGLDSIAPEHVKHAVDALAPHLTALFNLIRTSRTIPDPLKLGVMTPIGKKGKNLLLRENHRGITITMIIGKVLENIYREREQEKSHPLQFGFTKGLSPTMAALVLSEAITEAKSSKRDLFVATLDSQKAFDVVSHPSLLRKLFLAQDIDPETWSILADMHRGMSTAVRWKGYVSRQVEIKQGVRQGGVLSPGHYKRYVDGLLHSLQNAALGLSFGELYAGCPTVADDVLLLATAEWDLQAMLDIADSHASRERYNIQPSKSSITPYTRPGGADLCPSLKEWTLGANPLPVTQSFTHLGITRFSMEVKDTAISDKIQSARRTAYALMGSGLHGTNGLPAHVSLKIYRAYVLPRLLYGLEAMNLDSGQLKELEQFHVKFLRQIQSLPDRTAKCGVFILLGTIPIEAFYHLAVLSLLGRVLRADNVFISELAIRQTAMCSYSSKSWFIKAAKILSTYHLPPIHALVEQPPGKVEWTRVCKAAVFQHWSDELMSQAAFKPTLVNLSTDFTIGVPHPIWTSTRSAFHDIRKSIFKVKLITNVFTFQVNKAKFNKYAVDPTCPLCHNGSETLQHFLLQCDALRSERDRWLLQIGELTTEVLGETSWTYISHDDFRLTRFLLDCANFSDDYPALRKPRIRSQLEFLTRNMCFDLHRARITALSSL